MGQVWIRSKPYISLNPWEDGYLNLYSYVCLFAQQEKITSIILELICSTIQIKHQESFPQAIRSGKTIVLLTNDEF